jgi:hypothetical protein
MWTLVIVAATARWSCARADTPRFHDPVPSLVPITLSVGGLYATDPESWMVADDRIFR